MTQTNRTILKGAAAAILIFVAAIFIGPEIGDDGLPPVVPEFTDGRFLSLKSAAALATAFKDAGYDLTEVKSGKKPVPPLFLRRLPGDLAAVTDTDRRKALFIQTILPMALAVNQKLRAHRAALEDLKAKGETLNEAEQAWLRVVAARHKNAKPDPKTLLEKIAPLPVALIIAQAAVESGWGTSRFAREGNALFGQWTWEPGAGIVPEAREEGKNHAVKSYSRLIDSVWDYANNLNTHRAYADFREARAKRLKAGKPLRALPLIETLEEYSERGAAYLDLLQGIIERNGLSALNNATLSDHLGE